MVKRGQVTLFIIMGILILILIGVYLAFQSELREKPQADTEDFSSVRYYIESVLKEYSEHSLDIVGQQGGYIKKIQMLSYPFRINHDNFNVSTGIKRIEPLWYGTSIDGGFHLAQRPPLYPWSDFETVDSMHFDSQYKIGQPMLLPLEHPPTTSAPSVKTEIEDYLENVISGVNIDKTFENEYHIKTSKEPNVTVLFANGTTLFELNYPLNVTHAGSGTVKSMEYFETELPINFKKFYSFIEEVVSQETSYLKFDITDHTQYGQLPFYPKNNPDLDFSVSSEEIDDDFEIIRFGYHRDLEDDYNFQIVKERLIPAMYNLTPKNYTHNSEVLEYNLSKINLNKVHNEPDGFVNLDDEILNYIIDPEDEDNNQAIDPNTPKNDSNLVFTYGKVGDSYYDEYLIDEGILKECPPADVDIEFEINENTGSISIQYPDHHVNLVNYTCETRVFVSNQANSLIEDYESVYFQHTGRECLGGTQEVCYECCLDGCVIEENHCCDPNDPDCQCKPSNVESEPDLDSIPEGDTSNSLNPSDYDIFLDQDDVIDLTEDDSDNCPCAEWEIDTTCNTTCTNCFDGCEDDYDSGTSEYNDCIDGCLSEAEDDCENTNGDNCRSSPGDTCEKHCEYCDRYENFCDYCDSPCLNEECPTYPQP
ncbi:MAG: hypothetical protein ACOCQG_03095 [Candidatus Nanoarchaeia archaeon]